MNESIEVSIIIVSYNIRGYLLECIDSIRACATGFTYEIIVVDNASTDGSPDAAAARYGSDINLIRNTNNPGFAKANNQGYTASRGTFVLLLNPDTIIKRDSIESVLRFMRREPTAGVATCRIVGAKGTLQRTIYPFNSIGFHLAAAFFIDRVLFARQVRQVYYGNKPTRVDSINGAFMLIRRSALGSGSVLNEDYFMYAEEKDLSFRLFKNGWFTYFVPDSEIIHYGGRSTASMPIRMYLELQKSQVKLFRNFYSRGYALALCASWWFMLVTQSCASVALVFSKKGRGRLVLFFRAAAAFPSYVVKYLCKLKPAARS
jgi:O-antigen biosynthesis protein